MIVNRPDILFITDNNLELLGGEQESILILLQGLRQEYHVAIIQPGSLKNPIEDVDTYSCTAKLRMKSLIKNPVKFVKYIVDVEKIINRIRPEIIHSQSQVSFFLISLLKRLKRIDADIRICHTERGLYTKYNYFFKQLFQFSYRYLDVLVTTTKFNKACWKAANDKKNIDIQYEVIGNTAGQLYEDIDISRIHKQEQLVIGFAGRYCEWKNWSLAEQICYEIHKEIPDIRYEMCISCEDNAAQKNAEAMIGRLKDILGEKFTGRLNVPFCEMEQFYYDIDVFILTSWKNTESFGRTLVEAMSRKTAVLTTDAGGAVEVVNNPDTICDNVQQFVTHIRKWNSDRKGLDKEKDENLKRVRKEYSLESNIHGYCSLYRKITGF